MEKGSGHGAVTAGELDGRCRGVGDARRQQLWLRGRGGWYGQREVGRRAVCGGGGAAWQRWRAAWPCGTARWRGRAMSGSWGGLCERLQRGKKLGRRNRAFKKFNF
jgi:hypothetical protein